LIENLVFDNVAKSNQVVFFDCSIYGPRKKIPYEFIDNVRDGNFFYQRYGMCRTISAKFGHVVVFMKKLPDPKMYSCARYRIIEITNAAGDYRMVTVEDNTYKFHDCTIAELPVPPGIN